MSYPTDKEIINLLSTDPLYEAEKITGKSYKEDDKTSSLGLLMSIQNNMMKDKALRDIGDTVFSMDWLAYCELIEKMGFGLMLEDFSPNGTEAIRIYYNEKDGLLLRADSFQGCRNSASVYYNWQIDPEPKLKPKESWFDPEKPEYYGWWSFTSTGCMCHPTCKIADLPEDKADPAWKEVVWSGNHDAREALGFNMRQLRENGTFIPRWIEQPHLWLVGHWEKDDNDSYSEITQSRVKRLPEWVQDNIKGC